MLDNSLPRDEAPQFSRRGGNSPARNWIWNVPSFEDHMLNASVHPKATFEPESSAAKDTDTLEEFLLRKELQEVRGACGVLAALIGAAIVALPVSTVAAFFGYSILSCLLIYCGVSICMFVLLVFAMEHLGA